MTNVDREEQYLNSGGLRCPYCRTTNVSARPPSTASMEAWAQVSCDECFAEWNDVYKLVGIEITLGPSLERAAEKKQNEEEEPMFV